MAHEPHELEITYLLSDGSVAHYTCNDPRMKTLEKHGMGYVDNDPDGLLLIPAEVFGKFGLSIDPNHDSATHTIVAETLMRRISEEESPDSNRF